MSSRYWFINPSILVPLQNYDIFLNKSNKIELDCADLFYF